MTKSLENSSAGAFCFGEKLELEASEAVWISRVVKYSALKPLKPFSSVASQSNEGNAIKSGTLASNFTCDSPEILMAGRKLYVRSGPSTERKACARRQKFLSSQARGSHHFVILERRITCLNRSCVKRR